MILKWSKKYEKLNFFNMLFLSSAHVPENSLKMLFIT